MEHPLRDTTKYGKATNASILSAVAAFPDQQLKRLPAHWISGKYSTCSIVPVAVDYKDKNLTDFQFVKMKKVKLRECA